MSGAEISVPAANPGGKVDAWKVEQEGQRQWLVRIHNAPRLTLFNPEKVASIPADVGDLTGKRVSVIKPIAIGSTTTTLEDDFRESDDPNRALQERWIGQTRLEIKPKGRPPKTQKRPSPRGTKRSVDNEVEIGSGDEDDNKSSPSRPQQLAAEDPSPPQDLSTDGRCFT